MQTTTKLNQDAEPSAIAPVRVQPVVRLDPDTDKIPEVPRDDYKPVWNYQPDRVSADDSMAMGYMVWRKVFVGYVGSITGVMLGPEWADILEPIPTEPNESSSATGGAQTKKGK